MEDDVKQSSADRYAVSQAYRWKAERDQARQELEKQNLERMTTCSAYDLLPDEDRDAMAWVRENGGLDVVKRKLRERVPIDTVALMVERHKAKRERLKAHAEEVERRCGQYNYEVRKLRSEVSAALEGKREAEKFKSERGE